MKNMKLYKTIIFANGAEAFKNVLIKIKDKKEKRRRLCLEHSLSERAFFWKGDNKIVITPFLISPELVDKNMSIANFFSFKNLAPSKLDVSLSKAVMKDRNLWNTLLGIIKDNPGMELSPYSVTEEFLMLVEQFKKEKLEFSVCEQPSVRSTWTISYLDSKAGFREEMLKFQSFVRIPDGFICRSKKEAIEIVKFFYANEQSCVIKSNYGESGWGLIFIKQENYSSSYDLEMEIRRKFDCDNIWENEIIIVEEFIECNPKIGGGFPSVEVIVTDKGPEITYSCIQLFGDQGEFIGVVLGKIVLNNNIKSELYRLSYVIGKRYWELGYRGFFDIDFVVSQRCKIYALETNARRTGGTHVFDIAREILGSNWEREFYILSQDFFRYGSKILSADILLKTMYNILFPIQSKKKGVIITVVSRCVPSIGFVIIASTSKEAKDIYSRLLNLFHK